MEYFPKKLTKEETRAAIDRINSHITNHGFGLWAAEHLASDSLMGFVGIQHVPYETEFTPAIEIGWRLSTKYWGKGLATEAAKACLRFAFREMDLEEVVSFTAISNQRSFRVMERIGMTKTGEFDHPKIEDNHPLKRHVLYRLDKSSYLAIESEKVQAG